MLKKCLNGFVASLLFSLLLTTAAHANYLGCFSDNSNRDLNGATWEDANLTTESCVNFCAEQGFSYAGTQFGTQCFCGNSYGNYGISNECNVPCAGDASQLCGGVWTNSVHSVDITTDPVDVIDASVFTPFAGKIWIFNGERSYDEIKFDATLTDNILFGIDTVGQVWGLDYDVEQGQYTLLRVETGEKTNAFRYTFTCYACTIVTAQYLIIYDLNGNTTTEGSFAASGQLKTSAPVLTEAEALMLFTSETWAFSSERSYHEINFLSALLSNGSALGGKDSEGNQWLLMYDVETGEYNLINIIEEINGQVNGFIYNFTCADLNCNQITGRYLLVYDFEGNTETTEGPFSATGQFIADVQHQAETAALTLFAAETWVFNSVQSLDEITFDPTLYNESTLFGIDTKNQPWVLGYLPNENRYLLISLREEGNTIDTFNYLFTCDTSQCDNITGDYLIIYDYKGISETQAGPFAATGQLKGNTPNVPPSSDNGYPALGSKAVDAFNNPLSTNSTLYAGISVNGGVYLQRAEQRLSDAVKIAGTITVDPTHVGSVANIFVYAKAVLPDSEVYYMLDENLNILAWDLNPANLVAYQRGVQLTSVQAVSMYDGTFIYPGTLEIFFGYQLPDGTLVSNDTPIVVTIY